MTTYQFHIPASNDATLTIDLPEELRGEPLNVVVAKEPATLKHSTMREFVEKFTGILKDCDIESVEAKAPMKSPVQDLLNFCTKDVSLCTDEELDNDRYEYLMGKYR